MLRTGGLFSLRWPFLSSSFPAFTDTFPRSAGMGALDLLYPFWAPMTMKEEAGSLVGLGASWPIQGTFLL